MKKVLILVLFLLLFISNSLAQSYLGVATKIVNLREGPGTDTAVLSSVKKDSPLFIISVETVNDFYNVIEIRTNKEGYIHKSFIKIGERVEESEGLFTRSGSSNGYNSELEIYNDTSKQLTLKMNAIRYSFSPHERRTINISPGTYSFLASAPGVRPNIGHEVLVGSQKYAWQFYIVTSRW